MKISVVINTWNEEKNIKRCLESVKKWTDEIIVVDMYSSDKTVEIAKELGANVYSHKFTSYVEPARNFALKKTSGDWILILDADEEISASLVKKLKDLTKKKNINFFRIPRKNIIFNKWIKHSRWWPDYNIRFFRKGKVEWLEKIHSIPLTVGDGEDLEAKESYAILHHHYQSISQYLERINRYSEVQAQELIKKNYQIRWQDLINKPKNEFLSRFFAGEGYKDGMHGLVLALLQSFSELITYLKVWEKQNFKEKEFNNLDEEFKKVSQDLNHWRLQKKIKESNVFKKILLKFKLLR